MPEKKPAPSQKPDPSLKDPQNDLKNPASMPEEQQGKGGKGRDPDPEGRQGGYHE
jgi:hypothetical protein